MLRLSRLPELAVGFIALFSALLATSDAAWAQPTLPQPALTQTASTKELPPHSIWLDALNLDSITVGWGKPQIGQSVDRHGLSLNGILYKHGIGIHARSEWRIDLQRLATHFEALVGVDDEVRPRGSVTFEVWLDGKLAGRTGILKYGDVPVVMKVDLTGAKQMKLVVTDAGDGIDFDHANWCDAFITLVPGVTENHNPQVAQHPLVAALKIQKNFADEKGGLRLRVKLGHDLSINTVAYSPNGKYLLTGGDDGAVCLWEIATGSEVRRFAGHKGSVWSVEFSPDGQQALSCGLDHRQVLWDIATGAEIRHLEGDLFGDTASFSPDGKLIVVACADGSMWLFNAQTGKKLREFPRHPHWVTDARFSSSGRYIVTGCNDGHSRLWNVADATLIREFRGDDFVVNRVAMSPDERFIASGSWNCNVRLWDAATGVEIRHFIGHTDRVTDVVFSPDGRQLATCGSDRSIRVWDIASGAVVMEKTEQAAIVRAVRYSPDGLLLASVAEDRIARLWQLSSAREVTHLGGLSQMTSDLAFNGNTPLTLSVDGVLRPWGSATGGAVTQISMTEERPTTHAFSPGGGEVLVGDEKGTALVKDTERGEDLAALLWRNTAQGRLEFSRREQQMDGHWQPINCIARSNDGRFLVTGDGGQDVVVWEADTGRFVRRIDVHGGAAATGSCAVLSIIFAPDSATFWTGGRDNTVRRWDLATGRELLKIECGEAYGLALPAGEEIVVIGTADGFVRVCEAATGKELRRFRVHETANVRAINGLKCSPNGKIIAIASDDGTARLYDLATLQELSRLEGHTAPVTSLDFSPDGEYLLTGSSDSTARLWAVETGLEVRRFQNPVRIWSVAFAPDGKTFATGGLEPGLCLFDVQSGQQLGTFTGHSRGGGGMVFSSDGQTLISATWDRSVRWWEIAGKREVMRRQQRDNLWRDGALTCAVFSNDGAMVATGGADGVVRIWRTWGDNDNRLLAWLNGHTEKVRTLAFSPDSKFLISGSDDNTIRLWQVNNRDLLWQLGSQEAPMCGATFSQDGQIVITHDAKGLVRFLDAGSGREIRQLDESRGVPSGIYNTGDGGQHLKESFAVTVLTPDGRSLLTAGKDKIARLWDLETGQLLRRFVGHDSEVRRAVFSPDGNWLLTSSDDQSARIWDVATAQQLCSLFTFRDGNWAVVDPEGRYDTSSGSENSELTWLIGLTPIGLTQFKDGFYEPGLLGKKLGFNKEPVRAVPTLADLKLFPEIDLKAPTDGKATIALKAHDGGIGPVQVWINGKEWKEDARPVGFNAQSPTLDLSLSLDSPLIKPGEENVLRVVARNAQSTLASPPREVRWTAPGTPEPFAPRLYAIVCGISQYANPKKINTLRFAAKDARDMALALAAGSKELFGADKTEIHLLTGEGKTNKDATAATKANLKAAFDSVAKKARPQDVLVVYMAGHGTTLGLGSSVYCYPTQDADSPDFAKANMAAKMITSDELAEWTKAIAAQKQVLILDTCASGAAGSKLTEKRAVPGDQVRAIERLKDRTGYHVLMGCAADSVSYEASRFNQGLLTYALLEGMKGPTRAAGKGVIGVDAWFTYAQKKVPQLAGALGGIQQPQIATPRQDGKSEDFPIAQLNDQTAQEVPLSPGGVLVTNPRIVDETGEDTLNLESSMKNTLQAASLGQLQIGGRTLNGLTYVPVEELPGAWRVSGSYEIAGDQVQLNLSLHSEAQVLTKRTLIGRRDALPELTERAVAVLRSTALGLNAAISSKSTVPVKPRRKARSLETNEAGSTASSWFAGTPLPASGEIALAGAVDFVDADKNLLTLSAVAFQLPSGKIQLLTPPKTKLIALPAGTQAEDWQIGDALIVIGRDLGKGQVLPARLLLDPGEIEASPK